MSRILTDWVNSLVPTQTPITPDTLDTVFRSGHLTLKLLSCLDLYRHPHHDTRHDTKDTLKEETVSIDTVIRNYVTIEQVLRETLGIRVSSTEAVGMIHGKRGEIGKLLYRIKSSVGDVDVGNTGNGGKGTKKSEGVSYPSSPVGHRTHIPPPPPHLSQTSTQKQTYRVKEDEFFCAMLKSKLKRGMVWTTGTTSDTVRATDPDTMTKSGKIDTGVGDAKTVKVGKKDTKPHRKPDMKKLDTVAMAAEPRDHGRSTRAPGVIPNTVSGGKHGGGKMEKSGPRDIDDVHGEVNDRVVSKTDRDMVMQKKRDLAQAKRRDVIAALDTDITVFETKLHPSSIPQPSSRASSSDTLGVVSQDPQSLSEMVTFIQKKSNMSAIHHMKMVSRLVPMQPNPNDSSQYLNKIRNQRIEEEYSRKDRDQRRRKIILSQQQAQLDMDRTRYTDLVVSKLMRQSKQERRIAEQLVHIRHEKDVMHENRIYREKQYMERRQHDYEDAIAREYELAERCRLEYRDQMMQQMTQHQEILALKKAAKHEKHLTYCRGLVGEILDLMFKVAEYRVLNDGKDVPKSKLREWKILFVHGESVNKPVIVDIEHEKHSAIKSNGGKDDSHVLSGSTGASALNDTKPVVEDMVTVPEDTTALKLLDDNEFTDYIQSTGLWSTPGQDAPKNGPLGIIVDDIITLTTPPEVAYETVQLPSVPLRIVILGKRFAGKSTVAKHLADKYNMVILRIDELMREAIRVSDPVPKKPVTEKQGDTKDPKSTKKMLTKPQIGARIQLSMLEGQSPDDTLLVALVMDALSQPVTKPGGCILVDFPRTRAQAQLLERELSGYEDPKPVKKGDVKRTKDKDKSASKNRSLIAPVDGQPDASTTAPVSGLDCVLMLDVDNEVAVSRSAGQRIDPITGKIYHLELDPPPKNVPGTFDRLAPVEDESKSRSQLHYQLSAFEDEEDQIKEWFGRFHIMRSVDANQVPERIAEMADDVIAEIIEMKEIEKKEKEAMQKAEDGLNGVPVQSQGSDAPEPLVDERDDEGKRSDDARGKLGSGRSRGMSAAVRPMQSTIQPPGQQVQGATFSQSATPQATVASGERPTRVMSPSETSKNKNQLMQPVQNKDMKRQPTPAPGSALTTGDLGVLDPSSSMASSDLAQEPPPLHHIVRTPGPGGRKLPSKELAEVLMDLWATLESTYTDSIKFTFRSLRREQEAIIRFLHQAKTNFKRFLERPDSRQDMVELFQSEYNAVEDDLRSDPDAKSELHQRAEDLRDRLWEMSDRKREEAETERIAMIEDRWVEDHSHILANAYIAAMQAELDRFLNTRHIVIDYFRDANGLQLLDNNRPQIRVPMVAPTASPPVEIASTLVSAHEAQVAQRREGAQSANVTNTPSVVAQPKGKAPGGAGGNGPGGAQGAVAGSKDNSKDAGKRGANAAAAKAPPQPEPPVKQHTITLTQFILPEKEHLVIDYENVHFPDIQAAFDFCIATATQQDYAATELTGSADKKDKKKGLEENNPSSVDVQQILELEEQILRYRLERIRNRAIEHLKELRTKGFEMYIQLDEWIGLRFQAEMDAAKDLTNLIKEAIESEVRLPNQLVLEGEKFQVDFGTLVLEPEPEPRPESPIEKSQTDQFTVLQILNAARQLRIVASTGRISCKQFVDYIQRTAVLSSATDLLPENYCTADPQQFQQICYVLDPFETGFINWRKFLMLNSRVLPASLSSIADMRAQMGRVSGNLRTKISKSDFMNLSLWFEEETSSKWEESQMKTFDRAGKLKNALFYVFSEPLQIDNQLHATTAADATPAAQGDATGSNDSSVSAAADQQTGQTGVTASNPAQPDPISEKDAKKAESIVLGEHDRAADDGSLFDVLSFLACAALDESPMGGIEKAFAVFGSPEGLCSAQAVYDLFHHFLDLTDISHRFDNGESIEDPYPMDLILRIFEEAKIPKGGEISFEAFAAACESIGSPLISCSLFQIEDLTVYGNRSRPSSGLDPNKAAASSATNKTPA